MSKRISDPENLSFQHIIFYKTAAFTNLVPSPHKEGHAECASFLESQVGDLLLNHAVVDQAAHDFMLGQVEKVFTDQDNQLFLSLPTKKDVKEVLADSNLLAAPGTDGIPSLLYSKCWDTMGSALTEVVQTIFSEQQPTLTQRTSLMVFGSKPKKMKSMKPGDKRRISLFNSYHKISTGFEAKRFGKKTCYPFSFSVTFVAGSDRRIHHGINLARDTIHQAGKAKAG